MEWLDDLFSRFVAGIAWLIIVALILWMASVIVLLFRELFSPGDDLHFRRYLSKVWRQLLLSFEAVSYGGLIVIPFLMFRAEEGFRTYGMVLVAAILFSAVALYLRRHAGYWPWGKKKLLRYNRRTS